MDQIMLRERRFHEHAYLFILAALEYCQSRLTERRHIGGRELAASQAIEKQKPRQADVPQMAGCLPGGVGSRAGRKQRKAPHP